MIVVELLHATFDVLLLSRHLCLILLVFPAECHHLFVILVMWWTQSIRQYYHLAEVLGRTVRREQITLVGVPFGTN